MKSVQELHAVKVFKHHAHHEGEGGTQDRLGANIEAARNGGHIHAYSGGLYVVCIKAINEWGACDGET